MVDLEFDEATVQKLWTEDSPSHREFRYAHPQSSLQFIIKISRLGTKTVIMGVAIGDDKTTSFDFKTDDFTSAAAFPWTTEKGDVSAGFIRENRMKDLAGLFKINVLQKLIPGLSKAGYVEEENTNTDNFPAQGFPHPPTVLTLRQLPNYPRQPAPRPQPRNPNEDDPLRIPPRRPRDPEPMPDWEDPYDLTRPLPLFPQAGQNPLSIGHDDLNPPGLGSPFTPLPGTLGPDGLPRPGVGAGQGGMFMDVRGRGRGQRPPGVPPGARWDPIGPGRGGQGGGPNPFGGYMDDDFI